MDQILQQSEHRHQGSYIPSNSNCIFYHFLKPESITALIDTPIIINHRSYYPRRPRFVQPLYGLEIAVAGVGDIPQARSVIDHYIECEFNDSSPGPVGRQSCLALDDSVYCAILRTPQITQRLLAARDTFKPFGDSIITPDKPQYVYTLNATSIPMTFNARYNSSLSSSQCPDPIVQCQLDYVNTQTEAMASTLKDVVGDVKQLAFVFQDAQTTITKAFSDSTAVYAANNLLTSAQADVSNINQSIVTHNVLLRITPPEQQYDIRAELQNLREQLKLAQVTKDQWAAEVVALQAAQRPLHLPSVTPPHLSVGATPASSSQKRRRLQQDESLEENDVLEVAASMEVDRQVRNIVSSLL